MPRYLTDNQPIFICSRCQMKRVYSDMRVDPNNGLRVCKNDCVDVYDPWRLPARKPEDISLPSAKPDVTIPVTRGNVLSSQDGFELLFPTDTYLVD